MLSGNFLHSLSLKRRFSWSELTGLKCVRGIPHGCRPGSAVPGHLHTDQWPLLVPTSLASAKKREVLLDSSRPGSPPRLFRQVGGGEAEMTFRMNSPGVGLDEYPNLRYRLRRSTDGSARGLQRWRSVEHRTCSGPLLRRKQLGSHCLGLQSK